MTYEMNNVAKRELENNLPKNRKDLGHRTFEDHSSISSSDGELKLQIKQKLKSKKNRTTCFERKKKIKIGMN